MMIIYRDSRRALNRSDARSFAAPGLSDALPVCCGARDGVQSINASRGCIGKKACRWGGAPASAQTGSD